MPGLPNADWTFQIRADRPGVQVTLRWAGDPAILARSRLFDPASGRTIVPTAKAWAQGYPLTLTQGSRTLTWRYLGHPGLLP